MSDPKSFFSHDAEGENVTEDFWIAHFGHATEYNQLDEERRYHGFGGFVPSLQAPHNPKEQYKSNPLGAAPKGVKYDGSRPDDGEDAITYLSLIHI